MRTPLAKASDLYKLVKGEIKYDYDTKTVTHNRMYRRDGTFFDPAPYTIDDAEIELIKECIELAGGNDYLPPATSKEEALNRNLPLYISPDPCKHDHVGLKTISGKCYFCQPPDSPRQQAIQAGQRWYMPVDPCPKCGKVALRNTNNGQCAGCKPHKAIQDSPRQQAMREGQKWYVPIDPCPRCGQVALRRVHDSQCSGCYPRRRKLDSPRKQAMRDDNAWYTPNDPCPHCGQVAPRRVNNGQCSGCKPKKTIQDSPRQQAIQNGQRWYMPVDPCSKCGKQAPKRIQDSQCSGCVDAKSIQWIIEHPDMIITREMASVLGIEVYRIDIATGWKWVATGIKIK
jgi:rRNA maturation protein Nop10